MMSTNFTPAQIRLNAALIELFTASECWGGYLEMQPTAEELLYSARGYHPSGQEISVYPFSLKQQALLRALLTQYAEETPGGIGFLTVFVNLRQSSFTYEPTSVADATQAASIEATAQAERNRTYRERLRRELSPAPFGAGLADQVAEALARGQWLGYGHPAYCGMGLEFLNGQYHYGPIWEGQLEPERTFDRDAFVAWLAQQSDLSLALLELEEPTLWHNQTITRTRLRELVQKTTA